MEITDVLSKKGINRLKTGQILMFKNDKKRTDIKITKLDKKNKRAWGKEVKTYAPKEIKEIDII